jgi:hypothetical protein
MTFDNGVRTGDAYVEFRQVGNWMVNLRFSANNFTLGKNPTPFIAITNLSVGGSASNTLNCTATPASCAFINTTLRRVTGLKDIYQNPINNWTAGGNKRFAHASLIVPLGTAAGAYNTTFSFDYCLSTGACIAGG